VADILDLVSVHDVACGVQVLWNLLEERDLSLGISHKRMPTWAAHCEFVRSRPYKDWCIVRKLVKPSYVWPVGAVYLTHSFEIGIQIFRQFQRAGYGEWAVQAMMDRHPFALAFKANINPRNAASIALFRKLGFSDLQVTLQKVTHDGPVLRSAPAGIPAPAGDDEDPQTRPG